MNIINIKKNSSAWRIDCMLLIAVIIWAVSFPVIKLALNDWNHHILFFLAIRFWIAFLIFALIAVKDYSWQELIFHFKPGFWVGITLVPTLGFQLTAIRNWSGGKVAFIAALSSIFVPIGMWLIFRRRVQGKVWLGVVLATAGAILMSFTENSFTISAALLALIGAIGLSADIILVNYFMKMKTDGSINDEERGETDLNNKENAEVEAKTNKYKEIPFLVMQFLVLATTMTFLSLIIEIPFDGFPSWSNMAFFGIVFTSVIATAGAFYIQTKYQTQTTESRAALLYLLEPPLAALFSFYLLNEKFTWLMVFGALLIIIGVAVVEVLDFSNLKQYLKGFKNTSLYRSTHYLIGKFNRNKG